MDKYNMTKWGSLVALVVVTVLLLIFGKNGKQEAEEQTITVVEAEEQERGQEIQPVSEAVVTFTRSLVIFSLLLAVILIWVRSVISAKARNFISSSVTPPSVLL